MSKRSRGIVRATSRRFSAFLKVRLPAKEMRNPQSRNACASSLASGEAVEDSAQARRLPMGGSNLPQVLPRVAAMNDDRALKFASQFHLANQNLLLHIAWRVVVVIIQADFAHGNHLGMSRQLKNLLGVGMREVSSFVGMDADGRKNPVVTFRDGRAENPGGRGPCLHPPPGCSERPAARARSITAATVGIKVGIVKVSVGIDKTSPWSVVACQRFSRHSRGRR